MKKIFPIITLLILFISCKENKKTENASKIEIKPFSESLTKKTLNNSKSDSEYSFFYLPSSTTNQIIKHQYYTLSYSEYYEQAEWVAYELKIQNKKKNHFKRPFFIEDPNVKTNSADWRNYKNSGYDKGHLCPAGDMTFTKSAFDDTFFTSNIAPQLREFNEGVWNRLEQKTRYWSNKYNGVYVITGGVLKKNLQTIGKEKVAIPNHFYKIILNKEKGIPKIIAFLIPNEKSDKPLYSFVVSVDSIEKITGIDFFPNLENKIENELEKYKDYKKWSFD
jgi:endonuclease G